MSANQFELVSLLTAEGILTTATFLATDSNAIAELLQHRSVSISKADAIKRVNNVRELIQQYRGNSTRCLKRILAGHDAMFKHLLSQGLKTPATFLAANKKQLHALAEASMMTKAKQSANNFLSDAKARVRDRFSTTTELKSPLAFETFMNQSNLADILTLLKRHVQKDVTAASFLAADLGDVADRIAKCYPRRNEEKSLDEIEKLRELDRKRCYSPDFSDSC